jgi:NAD(P)-dependent dehydrogenase (short-subunit alcohol dehydrogenase family)
MPLFDRTAVVTGATAGLAEQGVLALAKNGWRVLAVGGDEERGTRLAARAPGRIEFLAADLFSLADVKRLASEITRIAPQLDLLINSASGSGSADETVLTRDGLERTFALNVAAPFVLTEELLGPLSAARGRVVNVAESIPDSAKITLALLLDEDGNAGLGSHVRNKLALLALTREQDKRFASRGITVVSLHPGIIAGTLLGRGMSTVARVAVQAVAKIFGMESTLEQAAERYVRMGSAALVGGGYYRRGVLTLPPRLARDPKFVSKLWARLEQVRAKV